MKTIKSLLVNASLAAASLVCVQVHATQGSSQYVENVDINFPGMAAVINIKNTSANKSLSALSLNVQENKLDFEVDGAIYCNGSNMEALGSLVHFGPVQISGAGINDTGTLHSSSIAIAEYVGGNAPVEYTPASTFSVPLNKVKNGHPVLRVDPLEELNKKLQAHLQGGGKEIDFYKHDQEIVLQRPLSLSAACRKQNNPSKVSSGFETKNHTIQIKYKGDPALTQAPVLKAQLQGNMPNQVQAGDQPFILHDAEFMANIPHHIGQCVPDQNPMIRVNYHMSGDEMGEMDFRINSFSNQYADYGVYYENLGVLKNPKNAGNHSHFDFEFPLKEMLSQQKYSWMVTLNNKTYNHNMVLQMRYKPASGQLTEWKDMDTAIFKHRCVPQLNGQLGGGQGGIQGYDNNGPTPPAINGTIQAKPMPKPLGKAAPAPKSTPKPMGIRAPILEPTPKPMGVRAPVEEPNPKPVRQQP